MSTRTEMEDLIVFDVHKTNVSRNDGSEQEEVLGIPDKFDHATDDEGEQNDNYMSIPMDDMESAAEEAGDSNNAAVSNDEDTADTGDIKPDIKPLDAPRRYLLFDELIAIVVDYDGDGTPIVEFALADNESDDILPVECGICPDIMHKSRLAKHLKKHKVPGTNRYACIYCDETYKDYKYLAGHARRHMGIRPYVCEPCKLYFSTKQDLRVHNQRRHHTKEHICEVCGKTFSQNTMLKRHRESTHEKKRRFQCEHCPKAYYKNFSLQEHVRAVHMGKRRMLVCPFCGMQCRDAHKMARHRKQYHLNQKQFVCEVCHEEFTDINYFDAHKRSIQCRNNTRRRMEEDQLDQTAQQFESEQLDDEDLQDVVQFQQEIDQMHNIEEEPQEFQTILNDEEVDEIDLDQEQEEDPQNAEVIIYELDVDDDNHQH